MRPNDLPQASQLQHGTRGRYVSGCRCDFCRKANREYAKRRALAQIRGDWNGLIPTDGVRAHLQRLSKIGIGKRTIQEASKVSLTVIEEIRSGKKTMVRARTAKKLLAVTEANKKVKFVSADETWRMLRHLCKLGYSKAEISERLGNKTRAIQIRKTIIEVETAAKIQRLYKEILEEVAAEKDLISVCLDCGLSHSQRSRQKVIKRMLPATYKDIQEAYRCFYGVDDNRTLFRDLEAIGATSRASTWDIYSQEEAHG